MGRFIVIVLDGFGIGWMPDARTVRPDDVGANTLARIAQRCPGLYLPNLQRLGLMNAAGFSFGKMQPASGATFGKAALTHFGADTFWGHQEIMGTVPRRPAQEPLAPRLHAVRAALTAAGCLVETYVGREGRLLIVDKAVTVADNIECDPGLAINITAAIDLIPFERVMDIGRIVRGQVTASRVIAFGGRGVCLSDLLAAIEEPGGGFIGVNAPKSGVYERDYHCVHLGYGVDPSRQVPHILARHGVPVFLLGKVADIVENPYPGQSFSIVPTDEVMEKTAQCAAQVETGFICANVQETDLCGHRENADEYARILVQADAGIGRLLDRQAQGDILLVMADHGNDPGIGHPQHTREFVPLLLAGAVRPWNLGVRATLSDVAATVCAYFGAPPPENGASFLHDILKQEALDHGN